MGACRYQRSDAIQRKCRCNWLEYNLNEEAIQMYESMKVHKVRSYSKKMPMQL